MIDPGVDKPVIEAGPDGITAVLPVAEWQRQLAAIMDNPMLPMTLRREVAYFIVWQDDLDPIPEPATHDRQEEAA